MATTGKPTEATLVSCEVCLKEVPVTEATVAEAADYFVHFCGLECFEKWKARRASPVPQGDKSSG